jgi:hypothetical protein
MKSWVTRALRIVSAAALIVITVPVVAGAQAVDQSQPVPSYARHVDTISGTVSRFDGATTMYVRDVKGYIDNVSLHKGTIINPTGIQLRPGYPVTISGHAAGRTFVADEIDTPYQRVYPYPAYPYWGPSIGLGFGFGYRGWHRW